MLPRIIALVGLFVLALGAAVGCGGEAPVAQSESAGPSSAPATSTLAIATATPEPTDPAPQTPPTAAGGSAAPSAGQSIDVDVTNFTVSLMDGHTPVRTISPVAVGREIDTGVYNSTATGLFHVYSKTAALTYDAPYDTYIANSGWLRSKSRQRFPFVPRRRQRRGGRRLHRPRLQWLHPHWRVGGPSLRSRKLECRFTCTPDLVDAGSSTRIRSLESRSSHRADISRIRRLASRS